GNQRRRLVLLIVVYWLLRFFLLRPVRVFVVYRLLLRRAVIGFDFVGILDALRWRGDERRHGDAVRRAGIAAATAPAGEARPQVAGFGVGRAEPPGASATGTVRGRIGLAKRVHADRSICGAQRRQQHHTIHRSWPPLWFACSGLSAGHCLRVIVRGSPS